ncbi:MAG TPA: response regulator transcription factor [Opitutaceae bacterium]|nr:response regulator transcription factor [Opitutaceae bacterium]HUJ43870.1 response regulator transcription factor [Opitutaceae bacterium]
MRILIADDHAVVRQGLMAVLGRAFGPAEFGEAADSRGAIAAALREPWDLLVLDLSMPGRNGLEVLKELKAQRPGLRVLVLSMHAEEQYAVRAFRAGAAGYLTKANASAELVKAAERILAGGRYVSATLGERLASSLGGPGPAAAHEKLSDRELEILRLIGSGRTVKEIAAELTLSPNTISTYRARLLEKMKMRTTAELVHYAISNGLVE